MKQIPGTRTLVHSLFVENAEPGISSGGIMSAKTYKLVYSDNPNKMQERHDAKHASSGGKAILRLERKGRGGKTVTIIERLAVSDDDLKTLCKELKQKCGTGGTVKEHHIELQGDFRDKVRLQLSNRGYQVSG